MHSICNNEAQQNLKAIQSYQFVLFKLLVVKLVPKLIILIDDTPSVFISKLKIYRLVMIDSNTSYLTFNQYLIFFSFRQYCYNLM